ncbi:2-oxo-tetronate isomerase [Limnohabitans lacus]|uniref:Hydroxypyruvate isomerase family protein n=1 Tax=Limnohabitans lacus TaxID=3045173 RepID=A0ABT6X4Q6_9BURK|nr:2-oxo-tetronate isomerase [Limnohabitans sp. HM2-2]MDI9232952.1 hydroxypyruvate isomerase family protein [Limnohabitans sp. HM2-2]
MPRFAANLSMMYPDLPFLDRFEAAAQDGFKAVEYLFPYAFPAQELAARLKANGLQQVLFNTPSGGTDTDSFAKAWESGSRGTASVPGREAEFRTGFAQALDYAEALNCPRIHAMVGLRGEGASGEAADATLVSNLQWAAREAAKAGRDVLIEPINTRSVPGFHLNRQDHALRIVQAVGAANVKVQMDLFHCQIVEGDLSTKIAQYLPTGRVGHFQIAEVPHRHEPGTGEVNWAHIFKTIDEVSAACGWDGWIGCEYNPADASVGGTSRGLSWARGYL